MLSGGIVNMTVLAEVTRVLSPIDLAGWYNWIMSNTDLDAAKEQGQIGIKKYWRRASQIEIELDWLYDWIPALAIFVRHLCKVYDNQKISQNMSVKQEIDPK